MYWDARIVRLWTLRILKLCTDGALDVSVFAAAIRSMRHLPQTTIGSMLSELDRVQSKQSKALTKQRMLAQLSDREDRCLGKIGARHLPKGYGFYCLASSLPDEMIWKCQSIRQRKASVKVLSNSIGEAVALNRLSIFVDLAIKDLLSLGKNVDQLADEIQAIIPASLLRKCFGRHGNVEDAQLQTRVCSTFSWMYRFEIELKSDSSSDILTILLSKNRSWVKNTFNEKLHGLALSSFMLV